MKANEVYVVTAPDDPHIHGRKYKLLREEKSPILGTGNVWMSVDVESGELHAWAPEHFASVLKLDTEKK